MPSFARSRPAPRRAAGAPWHITDDVTWTRIVEPRERYHILYRNRDGADTVREIELTKIGNSRDIEYPGVMHEGKFKTMRRDRALQVLEQLTTGHPSSLAAALTYRSDLPPFPVADAVYRVATIAASTRTWTVDLNRYECTCPEKRRRAGKGYKAPQLGYVCPHIARAVLDHLPAESGPEWTPDLRAFLSDPRKIHIDYLK